MQELHEDGRSGTPSAPEEWAVSTDLLTADQVRDLLDVDRSTVYRMASDGRLPAVKIGRQWRFPSDRVRSLLALGIPADPPGPASTAATPRAPATALLPGPYLSTVTDPVAEALGVMMLVTDMQGQPVTAISNPCPWFAAHGGEDEVASACSVEWRGMAEDHDLMPRYQLSEWGFLCARAFVRRDHELVGMVLAGGIAPDDGRCPDDGHGLYHLDRAAKRRVLELLPRVASALSRLLAQVPTTNGHITPSL